MKVTKLRLVPVLAVSAAALGMVVAPTAVADCNSVGNSTLCSSGGTVRGSSGAPSGVPTFDPYPCVGDPQCYYYDDYDPGVIFDPPNFGIGRPGPVDPGYGVGRPGIGGGGGIGPR